MCIHYLLVTEKVKDRRNLVGARFNPLAVRYLASEEIANGSA